MCSLLKTDANELLTPDLAGIYFFKVNNGNTRKMDEICSKLAIKTPQVSLFLTLNIIYTLPSVSIIGFDINLACTNEDVPIN